MRVEKHARLVFYAEPHPILSKDSENNGIQSNLIKNMQTDF